MRLWAFYSFALCCLLFAATKVRAEENSFAPARSAVVTSVQKCLDQLDPADAAEIRGKFVQPYQECQRRLTAKLEKKKQEEAKAATETPVPVTPRNFVRVKQPEEKNDTKKEDKK
jgi:hypothetical protein